MPRNNVLNPEDIRNLSNKLEEFSANLPEQERNILDWLLARSQACTDQELAATATNELSEAELEMAAGGGETPMSLDSRLAEALGLSAEPDSGVSVGTTIMWSR